MGRARLSPPALRAVARRSGARAVQRWRLATARWRPLPDVVVIGTQRGGTTSLFSWLARHPSVAPSFTKEVHYFDRHYANGERWYRAHFPLRHAGRLALEATPYLLFHPLAPARAAASLPATTRFVVLLRDPVERAVSHYFHSRRLGAETEPLAAALALEDERLAGEDAVVRTGEESFAYRNFSYKTRGHYAGQLRRWFDAVGAERVLVMESEALWSGADGPARVVAWLGLTPFASPFPATNDAPRAGHDAAAAASLAEHFAPHDEELFELLGRRLWGR